MKLPGRYKGTRRRREPPSKIPAEMVSLIREAKPAILEALRNRPATCSPDCYELEPGIGFIGPGLAARPAKRKSLSRCAGLRWNAGTARAIGNAAVVPAGKQGRASVSGAKGPDKYGSGFRESNGPPGSNIARLHHQHRYP